MPHSSSQTSRWKSVPSVTSGVSNVRALLSQASASIGRVDDPERKRELEDAYEQAQVPLTEAVQNAHAFVFDQMRERLRASRERAEDLLYDLVNAQR